MFEIELNIDSLKKEFKRNKKIQGGKKMKPTIKSLSIFLLATLSSLQLLASEPEYIEGQYIVTLKESLLLSDDLSSFFQTPSSEIERLNDHSFLLYRNEDLSVLQSVLLENDLIEAVEKDQVVRIVNENPLSNDPLLNQLWGIHNEKKPGVDIGVKEAWSQNITGSKDIVVAVIDTGIDHTHPDLEDNMWINKDEIPGNEIDDDGNGFVDDVYGWDFVNNKADGMDDHNHGTHCAGTIGAKGCELGCVFNGCEVSKSVW